MSDPNCAFCKIIAGQAPAKLLYQDDLAVAFHDVRPAAPVHILVMPRKHIISLADVQPTDRNLLGELLLIVKKVAEQEGFATNGYRVMINTGLDGGQTIDHLHFHILAGRRMGSHVG